MRLTRKKRKLRLHTEGRQGGKWKKRLLIASVFVVYVSLIVYFLQHHWAHRRGQALLTQSHDIVCSPLLGWFTREDRLVGGKLGPDFVDLEPGDILLTLSTHSFGWRHGHVALVIDEDTTLESVVMGTDSAYGNPEYWREYSNYCVLRVKDVTPKLQREVTEYASSTLHGVPYHLSAGFIGAKAPEPKDWQFGMQCAYLAWYAWNHFGYDLDSDGGRLVTAYDLLQSDLLEVVQVYGMDLLENPSLPVSVFSYNPS